MFLCMYIGVRRACSREVNNGINNHAINPRATSGGGVTTFPTLPRRASERASEKNRMSETKRERERQSVSPRGESRASERDDYAATTAARNAAF